jgi:ABC-type uncharacterized transport system ATPase subunit
MIMESKDYLLEMRGIVKRFPGVLANDHVDFNLKKGEIHTLLGENGAGKSTLMSVLFGLYHQNDGDIILEGEKIKVDSPSKALRYGIGMVQQHFSLVPSLSVAENIILGLKETKFSYKLDETNKKIEDISKKFGLPIDPAAKIWQLSVAMQQRVEILKLLYIKTKIMILDEPTAVLTPQMAEKLFESVREIVKTGTSVIFISHKLEEVLEISDRITILRRGKLVGTVDKKGATKKSLANMMVGKPVVFDIKKPEVKIGEEIVKVKDLTVKNNKGLISVNDLSLNVRRGEIVGIAGVAGNGQRELAEAIYGLRKIESGSVEINGKKLDSKNVNQRIEMNIAYIPQDRKGLAVAPNFTVAENLNLKLKEDMNPYWYSVKKMVQRSKSLIEDYNVLPKDPFRQAKYLSGGNMQKLILARELELDPDFIIAFSPTRGLDVGAIEFVYKTLLKEKQRGAAILLIAGDLDEIFTLSDVVKILYKGEIVGTMEPKIENLEEIGLLMNGGGANIEN